VGLVEEIFTTSYELLPAPVRLILSRKYYIDYCMSHREPLLEKVRGFKSENYAESVAKGQLIAGLAPLPDGAQESSVPAGSELGGRGGRGSDQGNYLKR